MDLDQLIFGRVCTMFGSRIPDVGCVGARGLGTSGRVCQLGASSLAQAGKWIGGSRAFGFIGLRIKRPPLGVPVSPHAGETTANFIFGTFATRLSMPKSGGLEIAKTGSYVEIDDFSSRKVLPAYGLKAGIVDLKLSVVLGSFCGLFNVSKSEDFESVYPFENQMDAHVGVVGSGHETVRTSFVPPLGWRRVRWLKRRGMSACLIGLGLSFGGTSGSVDCRNTQEFF